MKKQVILAGLFLMLFLLLSCGVSAEDQLLSVTNRGVLHYGTSADYIPFVYYDESNRLSGLDMALVEEIGRRMGVQVLSIDMAFDGLIDAVNLGQVDVIGGALAVTDERAALVDFTNPYFSGAGEIVSLKSSEASQKFTPESLCGMRIGVERGTSFDQWVKTNLVGEGVIAIQDVYEFSDITQAMSALDRKRIDTVIMDTDVYSDVYADSGKYQIFAKDFVSENYAFALAKGSTLTSVVNEYLVDMLKDGTAQRIADKYFSMTFDKNIVPEISRPAQVTPPPTIQVPNLPTQQPVYQQSCKNAMQFVSDVTIPDGSGVPAGSQFAKSWQIFNNGTCTWDNTYSLTFVSGANMGAGSVALNGRVSPGQSYVVSVNMTAPYQYGSFQSNWQMRSPNGQLFGQTIYVRINSSQYGSNPAVNSQPQQTAEAPRINVFQPNYYSGDPSSCPIVTWNVNHCNSVKIYVDGAYTFYSGNANDAQQFCDKWNRSEGQHVFQLQASNGDAVSYSQFTYTVNGGYVVPVVSQPTNVPQIPQIVPTDVPIGSGVTVTGNTSPIGTGATVGIGNGVTPGTGSDVPVINPNIGTSVMGY